MPEEIGTGSLKHQVGCGEAPLLSPSIHKYGNVFISSGLRAALGHEQIGLELTAERLAPNGAQGRRHLFKYFSFRYVTIFANRST